ncbi:hypothetical protein MAE02_36490 [Microvirga aerophila]|uniref:Calcium-binding protein n=2 Tax=Microvirga aerophila TaxID=670291 RepID=A0A512BVI8_9HYPH|nr:hypothetical protein MAE02_36490 [Microvirga aerophila]
MIGGEGDDDYFVDSAEDVVSEDATGGTLDRVISKINYALGSNVEYLALENGFGNLTGTGNALNNEIYGNDGNNVIDGGAGTDLLKAASGNDTVYGGDGDDIIEEYQNGNDSLNGGNGNDKITAMEGNDTLDGGDGADTLIGGAGDDLYMVDTDADMLIEDAGQGNDTVIASASYSLKAGVSVEFLSAQQGNAAINLTGNELNNVINGNAGNNVLDGSVGADMLSGGAGDDTYMVDNALDVVTEAAGQGTDTIVTSINLALTSGSGVEGLTAAVGALAINLTGNEGANTLKGNDGSNVLNGGLGKDVLSGGSGADIFVFDKKANKKTNMDRITDYDVQSDSIYLESNFFKKIGKGTFVKPDKVKKDFFSLKGHKDKNDYLAYNKKTGVLTFDADGSGKAKAVEIASLNNNLKMTEKEFFII